MLVSEVMIKDNLVIVSPMAPVRDALMMMRNTKVKSLIVDKIRPSDAYGLLTYKNILYSIVSSDGDIDLLRVYDICSKPAIQVSKQLDLKYASQLMVKNNVKRLLVVDNNELEGILTMTDILTLFLGTIEEEA
ncbi:CBS domain-containing protein [Sulfurospirillum multivorans]|uniref:Signal-transduction protein with 2 CBS domains n=2 Tax=Sulfurospirillum multivorans TaxID=66821 RepID=A0AA86E1T2_SULMK|nr:CBS domain-containing protein [Sulfurospirillum multivorans]AHJ12102.1 putative signal-transduction protein with 2 CBS domains [Sulfurospirillum multivorans DSM 12446]QEH05603.1 putative signal-transduction protein [Sulfurospirillum multivorans]